VCEVIWVIFTSSRKKYTNAIRAYSRAIKIRKTDVTPIYNLGRAYASVGQYRKAITAFRKVLTLVPRHLDTKKNLGFLLIDRGISVAEGISVLRKARRVAPKDAQILSSLAIGYLKQGKVAQGKKLAQRAKKLAPKDRFVLEQIRRVK